MNPTLDNDLQKAIDDITKNTNADPVFGDAVAAPAPATPAPTPVAPKPSMPRVARPFAPRPATPAPITPKPKPEAAPVPEPMPEPIAAAPIPPEPKMPVVPEPITETKEEFSATEIVEPLMPETPSDMQSVKEAALRDLAPILDKVDMDSSKKFSLYKNIHEELGDNSVIAPAYETAKLIADDKARADALLYLIDSIDNM